VLRTVRGTLTTPSLVIAANGFGEGFGLFKNRLLPLITWASMTRPMTADEVEALGGEDDYGIIPAHPAGTTVRRRPDNRILIRNQYTFSRTSDARAGMAKVVKVHEKSFRNRYPMLPDLEFEYSWGGALSLSRNGAGVCSKIGDGLWSTMAYQGVGMAKGTISGKFLAEHMMGEDDALMDLVLGGPKPSRNFPDPFNRWGVAINARWRRWQAGIEE
jgi:glycine/D-amino acid oxidase-like deaminating enzyme